MKKVTSEIVLMYWEDGEKIAIEYQNGYVERYMLNRATKADSAELLEVDKKEIK